MRTINIVVEDEEFDLLIELKGSRSWREFVNSLISIKPGEQVKVSKH